MRPDLTRPEIRRGPVHRYGGRVRITPDHLQSGVSILRVVRLGAPLPHGTLCTYLGYKMGVVTVAVVGLVSGTECQVCHRVPVEQLAVYVPPIEELTVSSDVHDFREGFTAGAWEAMNERPTSEHVTGHKPSWFGRGVVAGYTARMLGKHAGRRSDGSLDWGVADRELRRCLRKLHPRDWPFIPVPKSQRARVA